MAAETSASFDDILGCGPRRLYDRPADVLTDRSLTLSEQRAILSAWASDACAVESFPPLRHAPFASRPATFDEVMDALTSLDRQRVPIVDRFTARATNKPGQATLETTRGVSERGPSHNVCVRQGTRRGAECLWNEINNSTG